MANNGKDIPVPTAEELYEFQKRLYAREAEIRAQEKAFEDYTQMYKLELSEIRKELDKIRDDAMEPQLIQLERSEKSPAKNMNEPFEFTIRQALEFIPTFDGYNISVFQFIRECKRAKEVVPSHAEGILTKLIQNKLRGRAYFAVEDTECHSIADLTKRLRDVLSPYKTVEHYRGELASIQQFANEHIIDFISRVKDLRTAIIDVAEWEIEIEEVNTLTAKSFIRGLIPQIRLEIRVEYSSPLYVLYDDAVRAYKLFEQDKLRDKEPPRERDIGKRVNFADERYSTPLRRDTRYDTRNRTFREANRANFLDNRRDAWRDARDKEYREMNRDNNYNMRRTLQHNYPEPKRVSSYVESPMKYNESNKTYREQANKPVYQSYREPRDKFPTESNKFCHYCKNEGHDIHQCRKRQFLTGRDQGNEVSLPTNMGREAAKERKTTNMIVEINEPGSSKTQ